MIEFFILMFVIFGTIALLEEEPKKIEFWRMADRMISIKTDPNPNLITVKILKNRHSGSIPVLFDFDYFSKNLINSMGCAICATQQKPEAKYQFPIILGPTIVDYPTSLKTYNDNYLNVNQDVYEGLRKLVSDQEYARAIKSVKPAYAVGVDQECTDGIHPVLKSYKEHKNESHKK